MLVSCTTLYKTLVLIISATPSTCRWLRSSFWTS